MLKRIVNGYKGIGTLISQHLLYYPTPLNLKYSWSFGSLVGIFFALQLGTGIFLAMHYTASIELAFSSVVHIMVDVKNGWLIRYMHANGASMVFILLYCHIARGLYYKSYRYSRRYTWWSGLLIFILMMATAFIGYVLPWGQMSFWGATVITSLVTAVPFVGESIAYWIWGGFSISNATLVRFYSLHYLLPFVILGIVCLHLLVLHEVGSSEPSQSVSGEKITFHPYYIYKDGFILAVCMFVFAVLVFFKPNLLGHPDNFIKADPLVTPAHIVPEWYFTPFYAILRACPHKLGGVISMGAALLVLFVLPFYKVYWHAGPVNMSIIHKSLFWWFVFIFLFLMFLGGQVAAKPFVFYSRLFSFLYFFYFLVLIPLSSRIENWAAGNRSVPVTESAVVFFSQFGRFSQSFFQPFRSILEKHLSWVLVAFNAIRNKHSRKTSKRKPNQPIKLSLLQRLKAFVARYWKKVLIGVLHFIFTLILGGVFALILGSVLVMLWLLLAFNPVSYFILFNIIFILSHVIQGLVLVVYKLILPALLIVLSLGVVLLSSPIHALLALIGSFLCMAIILISLNIEFLSIILLIIYIGAVSILFLFVIMLFNLNATGYLSIPQAFRHSAYIYTFLVAPKFYFLFIDKLHSSVTTSTWLVNRIHSAQYNALEFPIHYKYTDIMIFALNLYTTESFFFILLGFILLTAMLGAITLALASEEKVN